MCPVEPVPTQSIAWLPRGQGSKSSSVVCRVFICGDDDDDRLFIIIIRENNKNKEREREKNVLINPEVVVGHIVQKEYELLDIDSSHACSTTKPRSVLREYKQGGGIIIIISALRLFRIDEIGRCIPWN